MTHFGLLKHHIYSILPDYLKKPVSPSVQYLVHDRVLTK